MVVDRGTRTRARPKEAWIEATKKYAVIRGIGP